MDLALIVATWLHTVAFVIAWGYYGVLARMVLPGLGQSLDRDAQTATLVAIERRAIPLVALSLVLFTLTGTYLLLVNSEYAGLGNFFESTWTSLMLVKHVLVVGLVALGAAVDLLIRRAAEPGTDAARASGLRRVGLAAEAATAVGALIVLLTVAAQLSA